MADPKGFPWRWVLLGVATTILLTCLAGWMWLHSTGDLDAFAKEAAAAGVSLTPPPVDPAADLWWRDLQARLRMAPTFPLDSVTPETLERLAHPPYVDCVAWADRVPSGLANLHWGPWSELNALFKAQLLTRPAAELPPLLDRLLRFAAARTSTGDEWSWSAMLSYEVADVLARRRESIPAETGREIAAKLNALADLIEDRLRTRTPGRIQDRYRSACDRPTQLVRSIGIQLPTLYDAWPFDLGALLVERCGRGPLLQDLLEWHRQMQASSGLPEMVTAIRHDMKAIDTTWRSLLPSRYLAGWAHQSHVYVRGVRQILHLRLLAADLVGNPWPEDPFAVPGTPLHRVERDGVLLGAWSVGIDGIPNGGDRRSDCCMSLGAQLGKPNMGDALPPPEITK